MNLIIISDHPNIYSTARFIAEAKQSNISPQILSPSTIIHSYDGTGLPSGPGIGLHRTTGVLFDDLDLDLHRGLLNKDWVMFNQLPSLLRLRDKGAQHSFFIEHKFNAPPTLAIRGQVERPALNRSLDEFEKYSTSNFVIKNLRGSQGLGTFIIHGRDSLFSILDNFWAQKDQRFIIQPYLEGAQEFRLFFCNNILVAALEKLPTLPNEFRKNSACGNDAKIIMPEKLPRDVLELGMQLMKLSGCFYAGIDILLWKNQLFVLEINLSPGFKMLEEKSGINVAAAIIHQAQERSGL